MGPSDRHVHEGQARICTERLRDKNDTVIVQEKLDGSCVAVVRIGDEIVPLGRAGYTAITSPYEQHWLFHDWAMANRNRFLDILLDGERAVGEWVAQAHGTRYDLADREPFVLFDVMQGHKRQPVKEVTHRASTGMFQVPRVIHIGGPLPIEAMLERLEPSAHGALDPVEGAVWRVERDEKVDFLAKYVRPDKVDGHYLPEVSGQEAVWNWRPR